MKRGDWQRIALVLVMLAVSLVTACGSYLDAELQALITIGIENSLKKTVTGSTGSQDADALLEMLEECDARAEADKSMAAAQATLDYQRAETIMRKYPDDWSYRQAGARIALARNMPDVAKADFGSGEMLIKDAGKDERRRYAANGIAQLGDMLGVQHGRFLSKAQCQEYYRQMYQYYLVRFETDNRPEDQQQMTYCATRFNECASEYQ